MTTVRAGRRAAAAGLAADSREAQRVSVSDAAHSRDALYVHEAYVFKPADPEWARLARFRWWLVPHIVAGARPRFVVAPLQISPRRCGARSLTLHRWLGRLYVCAVIVASSLSLYIVLVFEDPANRWVMGTMGGLWLVTTVFAWLAARTRNLIQHRLWIGRSYCLTLTFVGTRFIPDMVLPGLGYVGTTAALLGDHRAQPGDSGPAGER